MKGYYPALSRVMIALMGPYNAGAEDKPGTALTIIKNCTYQKLKDLPTLYDKNPDKLIDKLPSNVTYDRISNSLTHTYRDGSSRITVLDALGTGSIDLLDPTNLRIRTAATKDDA